MPSLPPIGIDCSKPPGHIDGLVGPEDATSQPMTGASVSAELNWASGRLSGSGTPRLDAELLLAHATGVTRTVLLTMGREHLDTSVSEDLRRSVERRASGEPIAYIVGWSCFYDLTLQVTPDVLVPRPETELLVEWAIDRARAKANTVRVIDVGTGTGAVALALAAHVPGVIVTATDIEPEAVQLARRNCSALGLDHRVRVVEADLYPDTPERFDLVTANLPYVAVGDPDLAPDVKRYEPHTALLAGPDGLQAIRRLLQTLPPRLARGADVGIEIGWRQGSVVRDLAQSALHGAEVAVLQDLAGHDRLVTAEGVA